MTQLNEFSIIFTIHRSNIFQSNQEEFDRSMSEWVIQKTLPIWFVLIAFNCSHLSNYWACVATFGHIVMMIKTKFIFFSSIGKRACNNHSSILSTHAKKTISFAKWIGAIWMLLLLLLYHDWNQSKCTNANAHNKKRRRNEKFTQYKWSAYCTSKTKRKMQCELLLLLFFFYFIWNGI